MVVVKILQRFKKKRRTSYYLQIRNRYKIIIDKLIIIKIVLSNLKGEK